MKSSVMLEAQGEAEAILAKAEATKKGIALVSQALKENGGVEAASLRITEQWINAFGNVAKEVKLWVLRQSPQLECWNKQLVVIKMLHTPANEEEEIFENQRHSSILGWGNKRPTFRRNEPGHWRNRNLSYSANNFFEAPLPPGWTWMPAWMIDKSESVDMDGWAYGRDQQSLKWPPTPQNSSKSVEDSVRHRRWICTRQKDTDMDGWAYGRDHRSLKWLPLGFEKLDVELLRGS